MEPADVRAQYEDFARTHEAARVAGRELPDLPAPPIKGDWERKLEELMRTITAWIEKHLNFKFGTGKTDMTSVLWVGGVFLIIVLTALILVAVWNSRARRERLAGPTPMALTPERRRELLLLIETAERAGRWNEASRVSWKMFLLERKLPESWTPRMFRESGRDDAALSPEEMRLAYEQMFSNLSEESGYRALRRRLFGAGATT